MIRTADKSLPDESLERPDSKPAADAQGQGPGTGDSRAQAGSANLSLAAELAKLGRLARIYGNLELSRVRIGAERAGLALARRVCLVLAGLLLASSMLVLCIVGLVGGLATLTGLPWWSVALAIGIVTPLAGALWLTVALRRHDTMRAKALRRDLQRLEPAP